MKVVFTHISLENSSQTECNPLKKIKVFISCRTVSRASNERNLFNWIERAIDIPYGFPWSQVLNIAFKFWSGLNWVPKIQILVWEIVCYLTVDVTLISSYWVSKVTENKRMSFSVLHYLIWVLLSTSHIRWSNFFLLSVHDLHGHTIKLVFSRIQVYIKKGQNFFLLCHIGMISEPCIKNLMQ